MLKRILLENFRSHKKTELEFGKGTNVLVGVIGAGKTSVMDAICFALFGTFPALQNRQLALDEVIMNRPNEMDMAKIELEFVYGGKEYVIERMIRRKGSNEGKLKCEGRLIAGPKTTDVTKKIEEITDVNFDLFSRAVYSEQNQIDYFLRLNPAKRKEQFDDLLQLNKYEDVRARAVSLQNKLRGLADERGKWLKECQGRNLDKELAEIEGKISGRKEREEELQRKIILEKKSLGVIESTVKKLEETEKEALFFKELLSKSEGKKEELEKSLKSVEKRLGSKTPQEIQKELEEVIEKIKSIKGGKEKLGGQEKDLQKKLDLLVEEIGGIRSNLRNADDSLKELESIKGKCPTCKRELNAHSRKDLEDEFGSEKKKLSTKLKDFEGKKSAQDKEMGILEKDIGGKGKELEGFAEKKNDLEELLERAKDLGEKKKQISDLNEGMERAKTSMDELGFKEAELRKERESLGELKVKISSMERDVSASGEMRKELEKSGVRLKEDLEKMKRLEMEINGMRNSIEKISFFINALKATQEDMRAMLVDNINAAMDDIWARLYPYGDFSSAKLVVNEKGYEVMVRDRNGKWLRVDGILSGGERSAAAITLRIAISLVLTQNLSWLILDEPTHNLDSETVAKLSEILREHLPSLVEQIFVITHDEGMERASSSSLYFLERDKNEDGATKVIVEPLK